MSTAEGIEGTETPEVTVDTTANKWLSVVVASLVGGIVMGLPMQFVMDIMHVVGGLYGYESVAVGWIGHLFHSVVFGLVFAGVVSVGPLKEYAATYPTNLGVGAAYGFGLWIFGGVIAMPLWLQSAGVEYAPSVPNLDPMSLVGHVAFGVVVAGLLPVVYRGSEELRVEPTGGTPTWKSATAAGFVAGLFMTAILHFVMDLMPTIAALYGLEGVAAGVVMHTFHSVVFALVFAGAVSLPVLRRTAFFPTSVIAAVIYGVGVWVFGSVYAMPLWLQSIGFEYAPEIPNIAPTSLLAHLVYGGVLGVVYPLVLYVLNKK
jgi:hypothetical protein